MSDDGAAVTDNAGLRIGVLGPLVVTRDGATVRLRRGRAGVLLAVLAMSAGRPVSPGRLAGLIWDDDQPEHSRASLHTVVARLRGIVPGAVVTADAGGYLLDTDPDHVDVLRFRRLDLLHRMAASVRFRRARGWRNCAPCRLRRGLPDGRQFVSIHP